jgi:hypothetical protein
MLVVVPFAVGRTFPNHCRPRLHSTKSVFAECIAYLLTGIPATGDDGNTADLKELHFGEPLLLWALVDAEVEGRFVEVTFSKWGPEIKSCACEFPAASEWSKMLVTNHITCRYLLGCLWVADSELARRLDWALNLTRNIG